MLFVPFVPFVPFALASGSGRPCWLQAVCHQQRVFGPSASLLPVFPPPVIRPVHFRMLCLLLRLSPELPRPPVVAARRPVLPCRSAAMESRWGCAPAPAAETPPAPRKNRQAAGNATKTAQPCGQAFSGVFGGRRKHSWWGQWCGATEQGRGREGQHKGRGWQQQGQGKSSNRGRGWQQQEQGRAAAVPAPSVTVLPERSLTRHTANAQCPPAPRRFSCTLRR